MKFPVVPVLLGVGVLGALVLSSQKTVPAPTPTPIPTPQPRQDLINQMLALVAQAKQNPQSVNPDQMDALAAQLDLNGYKAEAAFLRQAAMDVRLGQQRPPILAPGMQPPINGGNLLQKYNELLNRARNPQSTLMVSDMETLVNDLRQQGYTNQAQVLQLEAEKARLERDPLPCLVSPCPYGPVKLNKPVLGMETWISTQGTGFIIPNTPPGEWGHVKVRPTKIDNNNVEAVVVAYKPTIQSPELKPTSPTPILLTIALNSWKPTLR